MRFEYKIRFKINSLILTRNMQYIKYIFQHKRHFILFGLTEGVELRNHSCFSYCKSFASLFRVLSEQRRSAGGGHKVRTVMLLKAPRTQKRDSAFSRVYTNVHVLNVKV